VVEEYLFNILNKATKGEAADPEEPQVGEKNKILLLVTGREKLIVDPGKEQWGGKDLHRKNRLKGREIASEGSRGKKMGGG